MEAVKLSRGSGVEGLVWTMSQREKLHLTLSMMFSDSNTQGQFPTFLPCTTAA